MTTYKLKLNQVREVLGMEVKLETAKLTDGTTVVEYEKLEPGFPVFVVSEDGTTKAPAPAGKHILEGGIEIEVDEAGILIEVSSEGETPVEDAEVETEDQIEVSGEEVKVDDKVDVAMQEVIEEKIAEKMKMIFEVVEEVAKDVAMIKEEMGTMKTKMEKFAKAPAAAAAPKITDTVGNAAAIDSKLEFIRSLKTN